MLQGRPLCADTVEVRGKAVWVLSLCLLVASCGIGEQARDPGDLNDLGDWSAVWRTEGGLDMFSWTDRDRLIINTADGPRDFVAGINLGVTIPGHFPGELAVPVEVYRDWFPQMASLGFTAVRVYTMMEPHFYEELAAYNTANPSQPLYLVHGAWPPEKRLLETGDLFAADVLEGFKAELSELVAVVHGDAEIADQPGRADGTYTTDVSPWLLAWAIGIEWDPRATLESDRANFGASPYAGDYFRASADATPTESWMAEMLDHLAGELADRGTTMPLSFVNWTTTDPLTHSDEPNPQEELVGIDPMHVEATPAWPGGYYAGYHVYPYYPDFQRFEEGIADFEWQGEPDAYAGLLSKLKRHHTGIPLVVLEYGVPTGMAKAHSGPQGRHQGDHREQRQVEINAELLEIIRGLDLAGGYLFSWADEWFKHTWNTMDFEPFERRPLWMNAWTNEAHFGVLAVEPGATQRIVIDGDGSEWEGESQTILESTGPVREVRATHDEGYLYLRLVTDEAEWWHRNPITIAFDVIPGVSGGLPDAPDVASSSDYAARFEKTDGTLLVRSSADPILLQYRHLGYVTPQPGELQQGTGKWNLHRLMTNRPQVVPSTGERLPVKMDDAGRLHHGTTDPASPDFDSRVAWNGSGNIIEVRLPWQGIGLADPSSRLAYLIDDFGAFSTIEVARLGIEVATGNQVEATSGYSWEKWNAVEYHERPKAGVGVLAEVVIEANSLSD